MKLCLSPSLITTPVKAEAFFLINLKIAIHKRHKKSFKVWMSERRGLVGEWVMGE